MDDWQNTSGPPSLENPLPPRAEIDPNSAAGPAEPLALPKEQSPLGGTTPATPEDASQRRRNFRRNLMVLLALALAAFVLTAWILVRLDGPLGADGYGPQEIVRAQLRALDRGQLRPAYDMFSARYREEVSFDAWRELVLTHSRMFHANVVRSGTPAQIGARVSLEIFLHGTDDKDYRARFTLIRTSGRWWIDDVHWTETQGEHDFSRA